MKKIFIVVAVAATFVACKSKTTEMETNKDLLILQDSSMMYNSSYLSDTGVVSSAAMRNGNVNAAVTNNVAPAPKRSTSTKRSSGTYSSSSGTSSSSSTGTSATTKTTEKKGWSKAAKGAVIGGVGGAVTGAVIGKGGKGAVIGGVIGAAGGYIIGRSKDKKDGRVQ